MQQTYPTNVVAHVELLVTVHFFTTINLLISRRPGAAAPRPSPPKNQLSRQILASILGSAGLQKRQRVRCSGS
jgi:hypothetical protein